MPGVRELVIRRGTVGSGTAGKVRQVIRLLAPPGGAPPVDAGVPGQEVAPPVEEAGGSSGVRWALGLGIVGLGGYFVYRWWKKRKR